MTRISAGIRAVELCDKHLNKERIEILRIPNKIKKVISAGKEVNLKDQPRKYKLGKGHEIFFRDKLKYLHDRYDELTNESKKRGFNCSDFSDAFQNLPPELYNNWLETVEARKITINRVNERLSAMKVIRYYKKEINIENMKL